MRIHLQEFPHWIFLFHCRLLSGSADLHATITSMGSQSCFNGVLKGLGTPFPRVPPTTLLKSPTARPSVHVTMKAASQHFLPRASFKPIWSTLSKWVPHLQRASRKCRQS